MDEKLEQIQKLLDVAEGNLQSARNLLRSTLKTEGKPLDIREKVASLDGEASADIVQGVFDGEKMISDGGKEYLVPANYASKSKLVEGDTLKLTIAEDGSFIYKQINPVERKNLVGTLSQADGMFIVNAGGKDYKVLTASVTFYKAQPGDQVTVVVPNSHEATWAAMENVITTTPVSTPAEEPQNPQIVEPEIILPDISDAVSPEVIEPTLTTEAEITPEPVTDIIEPVVETIETVPETPQPMAEEVPITIPQPVPTTDPNSPQIEFPAGNENVSDDELLENLKNNLKNIQTTEYVSPQAVIEETRKADELINNAPKPAVNPKADEPISELEI